MSFTNGPIFTSAGKALHARAIAGAALKFTKVQLGDGQLMDRSIDSLTGLIHPVASVEIATMKYNGNFAVVGGVFTNSDLSTGFYWREVGLFAADPDAPDDRSRDILYCYQSAGNLAEYIAASDSEIIFKRINIAAIVDDAATVSAVLAPIAAAADISFDNTGTGLDAEDVQSAISELAQKPGGVTSVNGKTGSVQLGASDVGASPSNHNHNGVYAPAAHNHNGTYAPAVHDHNGVYAPMAHNHDGAYAPPYTYGPNDLVVYETPLGSGIMHVVYE